MMARLKKSAPVKNTASALFGNAVNILVKFIAQRIFIETLGVEYLGLNGILINVMSILGIVELGVSSAIIFNLYEPLKNGHRETVKALLRFYKKAYNLIALITVGIGLVIMPFLHLIVREAVPGVNMYVAYLLALAGAVTSYLLSYRQSILYATEQGRTITRLQTLSGVLIAGGQILILKLTGDYYLYLLVNPIIQFIRNLALHKIASNRFPFIREKNVAKLEKNLEKDIFKKMRALFIHKVSTFVIFSTDNIIISMFINVATVGLYSNYHMIFSAAETILLQALKALTPTIGTLLVDKNKPRNYQAFRKIRNITFAMAMVSSLGILCLADPFIRLWVGREYVLPIATLVALVVVHFQTIMRCSFSIFKEAAGIFHEDRFVPVVESLINIVASVILVQCMGLTGVFIGTFLSSLTLWCYSYPKYIYKRLFGRNYKQYAIEVGIEVIIFAVVMTIILIVRGILGA